VIFPDPATQIEHTDGFGLLSLETLLELKLASGMTAPHCGQDLVDVMELIRARKLPRDHADRLDEYVRSKYLELWELAQRSDDY
jgi:hypothetical protein